MPAAAICAWTSFALAASASAITWTTKPEAAGALAGALFGATGAGAAFGASRAGTAGSLRTGGAAGSGSFVMAFFSSVGGAAFLSAGAGVGVGGGADLISVESFAAGSAEPGATGITREVNAESGGGILMVTS